MPTPFFQKPENFIAREKLYSDKLVTDLKIVLFKQGHTLHSYEPRMDIDGFDISLRIEEDETKIQCKTIKKGNQKGWNIHKKVITPTAHDFSIIQHKGLSFPHLGFFGGVVAIEIDDNKIDEQPSYYYSDLLIAMSLASGLAKRKRNNRDISEKFLNNLLNDDDTIKIPGSLFFKVTTISQLASLIGINPITAMHRANLRNHFNSEIEEDIKVLCRDSCVKYLQSCSSDFA